MQSVGIRSVDLSRGPGGFGFTLSSQGPCVLSCILASSPAHKAGLRPGDQILYVNGNSVEKSPHEQVVKLIARSPNGVVKLGVRNCNDSVEQLPLPSPERPETSEEEIENDNILNRVDKVVEELKSGSLTVNTPSSLRHSGFANVSDQIINEDEIVSDEDLKASFSETLRSESSSDSVFLGQSNVDNRRSSEGDVLPGRLLYPALTPALKPTQSEQSEMTNIEPDLRTVVGYLGSIELPASSSLQTASLNAIRSCVRRLRAQKKVHVMFVLEVSGLGIQLIDSTDKIIVTYPIKSLAFTGVCSDDKRVFGIVTRKSSEGNRPNSWHSTNDKMDMANTVNCSCHVFSVDPEIALHKDHVSLAQKFHINCTPSSDDDGECTQFLSSSSSILHSINGLFKERMESQSTDGIGTLLQTHPPHQSERSEPAVMEQERRCPDATLDTHLGQLDNNMQPARNESVINECVMETPNHRIRVRVTDGEVPIEHKPFRHRVVPIQKDFHVPNKKGKQKYITVENQNLDLEAHSIGSDRDWNDDVFAADNGSHKSDEQDNTSSAEASPVDGHDTIVRMSNSKFYVNHVTRLSHSAENLAHSDYVPSSPSNLNVSPSACSSTQSIHSLGSMPGDNSGINGCVARWALGFDKLMEDPAGLKCFQEFLKKEFSEENIVFWVACEDFRNITNERELKSTAINIFDAHLSPNATMPVNIDSSAIKLAEENLSNPNSEMYRLQQQQVYTLMKFDSYPRFLKSDLYRQCVVTEMEGSPLPFEKEKLLKKGNCLYLSSEESECSSISSRGSYTFEIKRSTRGWGRRSSKKSTSSYDESKTLGEKKKSFLPWKGKQAKKGANRPFDSQPSSTRSSLSSLSDSFPSMSYSTESLEGRRESELFQFCRIVLPDHSSTIVTAKQGQTLRQTLMQLCERRHISFVSTEVFIGGADKPALFKELDVDIQSMAGKEVVLEHRSLFRLEISSGNFLIVKSKPEESLRVCLEPILHRNSLTYANVSVHLVDCEVPLDSGVPIASIEHQCVVVDKVDPLSGSNNGPPKINIKPPVGFSSPRRGSRRGSSWDDTVFDEIIRGKKQSLGDGYFDDAGVWVPGLKPFRSHESLNDDSFGKNFLRGPGLFSRKRKESNDKERSSSIKAVKPPVKNNPEVTELLDLLSRAQGKRMDDQRGELEKESFELPDFLRLPTENRETIDEDDSLPTPPPPPPPPPPPVKQVHPHQKAESLKLRREERPVIRKTLSTPAGMQGQADLMEELAEKLRRRSMSEAPSIPENHDNETRKEESPTRSQSYSPWERQEHYRRINVVRPRAVTDGAVFKVEAVTPVRLDGTTSLSHVRQQKLRVTHSESMPDTLPTRTSTALPIAVTIRGLHTSTGNIQGGVDGHKQVQKYHTYSSKQRTVSSSSAPDYSSNLPYMYEANLPTGKTPPRVRHISDTDGTSKGNTSPFHFPQVNARKAEVYIPSSSAICAKPYRVVSSGADTKPRPKPITHSEELMAGLDDDRNALADNESILQPVTSTPCIEGLIVASRVEGLPSPDRNSNSPLPLPPSPIPDQMDELEVADFPPPTPLCEAAESSAVTPDQRINKTITPSTNDRTFVSEPTNQGTPLAAPKGFRDDVSHKPSSKLLEDSLDSSRKPAKDIPKLDPYVTYETDDLRITFV